MWSLVDDRLRISVREHPLVSASLAGIENDVIEGRATPTSAAEQILKAFKS
jgi:LAO/AO transport system kinase